MAAAVPASTVTATPANAATAAATAAAAALAAASTADQWSKFRIKFTSISEEAGNAWTNACAGMRNVQGVRKVRAPSKDPWSAVLLTDR